MLQETVPGEVQELLEDHGLRQELRASLGEAFDLQRLTARVSTGRASPRDLVAVAKTLALLPRIKARVTARRSALRHVIDTFFNGSVEQAVSTLIDESAGSLSPEELDRLYDSIHRARGQGR